MKRCLYACRAQSTQLVLNNYLNGNFNFKNWDLGKEKNFRAKKQYFNYIFLTSLLSIDSWINP